MVAFQKTTERFVLASIMYSYFLDFTDDINPEVGTNIEMFNLGGPLTMARTFLGKCSLNMQTILKKCPFKRTGKLSKLFQLIQGGLNLPPEPDTLQNKILWGVRPRRTKSSGV